jgi:prepilin-type N-terminal cleavage/methylation domain-containing protein
VGQGRRTGFTLMEVVVAVILVGVGAAAAAPSISTWVNNQHFKSAVRDASGLVTYARGQALRTGNVQIVFFDTDAQGNPLLDAGGNQVPVLALDDGTPGSTNQNCKIDAGEDIRTINPVVQNVTWGSTLATGKVTSDDGPGDPADGWSFEDPNGNAANWVLFRGQGTPFSFAPDCTIGGEGSGAGAVYITNGKRDLAVVITPLGAVRVHAWAATASAWTN